MSNIRVTDKLAANYVKAHALPLRKRVAFKVASDGFAWGVACFALGVFVFTIVLF